MSHHVVDIEPQLLQLGESSPLINNFNNNERKDKNGCTCAKRVCVALLIASVITIAVFIALYATGLIRIRHDQDSVWKMNIETGSPDYSDSNRGGGGIGYCPTHLCGSNCFDSNSIVYRFNNNTNYNTNNTKNENIERVLLTDINTNDLIMSNLNGEFSKVLFDLFDNYNNSIKMNKICFDESYRDDIDWNSCLILGNNHLIFVNGIEINNLVATKDVKIGDYVYDLVDPIPVCILCHRYATVKTI